MAGLRRAAADRDLAHVVRDFLELGALPGAVPSARLHAHQVVWEWALTALSESVEQVVSELVANSVAAVRAMPQIDPVRLWLLSDRRKVLVLVWDANPNPPALIEADEYARKRPGAVPGASVQRALGVIPDAAGGRQGCLGSMRHEHGPVDQPIVRWGLGRRRSSTLPGDPSRGGDGEYWPDRARSTVAEHSGQIRKVASIGSELGDLCGVPTEQVQGQREVARVPTAVGE